MESLILSFVSNYLKEYVNNFRKEQISMNFLRGHGVIHNLDINVDVINDSLSNSSARALKVKRIFVNTLSIKAPILSLKTKPIIVYIDELFIEVYEIFKIDTNKDKNATSSTNTSSSATSTNNSANEKQTKTSNSQYGFLDRVVDSISLEINRVLLSIRPLGTSKKEKIGTYSSPIFLTEWLGNRFFCTNQNQNEAPHSRKHQMAST